MLITFWITQAVGGMAAGEVLSRCTPAAIIAGFGPRWRRASEDASAFLLCQHRLLVRQTAWTWKCRRKRCQRLYTASVPMGMRLSPLRRPDRLSLCVQAPA